MPRYTVTIREDSIRKFDVDAESPEAVKRMWMEDENQLGPAYDCDALNSSGTLLTPDGRTLDLQDIDEDDEDEQSELCECGRETDDCASSQGADYCCDIDDYEAAGCPDEFEEMCRRVRPDLLIDEDDEDGQ